MLRARRANHPVARFDVDVSVLIAARQDYVLFKPDVQMTRIDAVRWIVREIEDTSRFAIPSQDGRS